MNEKPQRKLDPRLRRQIHSLPDHGRLLEDVQSTTFMATVASAPAAAELTAESISPQILTRRVLVTVDDEVPEDFHDLEWSRIAGDYYAVDVPLDRIEALGEAAAVRFVEAARGYAPFLDTSLAEVRAGVVHNPPGVETRATGSGVVIGIIDSSLNFTLDDFRRADGSTRVAFLWDQNLSPEAGESSPAEFPFGVEYDRAAIDAAFDAGEPERIRHRWEPESHGTHVAGIAAGNGRSGDAQFPAGNFVGVAPEASLIFVSPRSRDQNSSFTDSANVARGIAYVFARAAELEMPAVINMSLGQNGGSHDGESTVERAIDRLLETPGRAFISAAGNEHVWRGHAGGQLGPGDQRTLLWKVGGGIPWPFAPFSGNPLPEGSVGDFSVNEMEIWYSSRDRLRLRVISPAGHATDWIEPDETAAPFTLPSGNEVFLDSERFTILNGDARIYIEVSPGTTPGARVETGLWEVEIEALEVRDGWFDGFIERDARRHVVRFVDGSTAENFFADQSFYAGDDFDPVLTLGTPATARRSVAVANYDHRSRVINPSSSRGPTRDAREKPELAAPGTGILAANSSAGEPIPGSPQSLSPARVAKTGTSMAAPHVAGIVALILERDARLTADQIRKILIAAAAPSPTGNVDFDPAWGFGQADARRAVDLVG